MLGVQRSTLRRKKNCRLECLGGEKDKEEHMAWLKAYSSLALLVAVLLRLWTPSSLALILAPGFFTWAALS